MSKITINISDELKIKINEIAVREDLNISIIVRKAIKEYLEKQDNNNNK